MKPELFLRWGLAFSFIYVAISGFLNPESWIGFVPDLGIIEKSLALNIHLAFDAVLGVVPFGIVFAYVGTVDFIYQMITMFAAGIVIFSGAIIAILKK